MKIINIHYKVSKPVAKYSEIKEEAELMKRFVVRGDFKGFYNKAFAIAHCQVSETPMSFFVVDPNVVREKIFEDQVIINPEIIAAPLYTEENLPEDIAKKVGRDRVKLLNAIESEEPCLSFPFRKPKRIRRFNRLIVKYQIKGFLGLKTIQKEIRGVASQIFQHEYDHTKGKNIYFESKTPVEWWKLIGTERSKGGTSLDNPADLNLSASKERPSDPDKTIVRP
jgi:peptide deformylase